MTKTIPSEDLSYYMVCKCCKKKLIKGTGIITINKEFICKDCNYNLIMVKKPQMISYKEALELIRIDNFNRLMDRVKPALDLLKKKRSEK